LELLLYAGMPSPPQVSQCNPYLLPIVALKKAMPGKLGTLVEGEFKHRQGQPRGGGGPLFRVAKGARQPP
jgi:hypothetical protein